MRNITALLAWILLTLPVSPAGAASDPMRKLPPLPVRLLEGTDPSILDNLTNVRLVKGAGPATLQLDIAHKRIVDAQGQMVVESDGKRPISVQGAVDPISLQGTVDKWRYVQSLAQLAAAHPQEVHIDPLSLPEEQRTPPLPRIYDKGGVTYVVTNVPPQRQVIIFNLDAIGGIQLLYVRDAPEDDSDVVAIDATVRPIFGVEHVVAVSAVDREHMRSLVAWMGETARADGMLDTQGAILEQIAALKDVRVGIVAVYTCKSPTQCKR